jgi:restriction system protein
MLRRITRLLGTLRKREARVAKRKQVPMTLHAFSFQMLVGIGILWAVSNVLMNLGPAVFIVMLLVAAVIILMKWMAQSQRATDVTRAVNKAWAQHERALVTQHAKLVQRDVYGREDRLKWDKELVQFATHHVVPLLKLDTRNHLQEYVDGMFAQIDARVREASAKNSLLTPFSSAMHPTDFEHFCADALRKAGWSARVTQASADQGVDVVAERAGRVLVLQCKLYSKPVGNKAVQEIAAGRAHEQAEFAAVCSNQTYTPAAVRLAGTNQVLLLHPAELDELHQRLGLR